MMFMAYFQEDEALRYSITPRPVLEHRARFECEKFLARMTNPEVGMWWIYLEEEPHVSGQQEELSGRQTGQQGRRQTIALSSRLSERNDGGQP